MFEINQNKLLMKKTLLLGCAVGLGLAASAQSNGQGALSRPSSAASAANDQSMVTNVPARGLKTISPVAKTNAVTIKNLGTSRNAFGNAFGVRQMIVASNASNSVALVRRHTLQDLLVLLKLMFLSMVVTLGQLAEWSHGLLQLLQLLLVTHVLL